MQKGRKALGVTLASAMVLGSFAGITVTAEEGALVPGTYTASAFGMESDVTVTVTVGEDGVAQVTVDSEGETPGIGQAAAEPLAEAFNAAQSADVEAVSGATITSTAAIDAATKAFEQAAAGAAEAAEEGAEEGTEAAEGLTFTPGTYTETSEGYNGPVQISVTFDETSITDMTTASRPHM